MSLALAVVVCLLVTASPAQYKAYAADSVQSLRDKSASLKSEIAQREKEIEQLKNDKSKATAYKNSLDDLSTKAHEKIIVSEALAAELEQNIADTEKNIAEKETEIEVTMQKFLDRMCASYEEGEASYLSILLGSESMSDFLSRMDIVSSMLDYDKKLKEQYKKEKEALEAKREELAKSKAEQEQNLQELEAEKKRLDTLSANQDSVISALEKDQSAAEKAYLEAKKDEEKVSAEIKALLSKPSSTSTPYVGGPYQWPLTGHTYVSSGYGNRILFGRTDFHLGIDIPAPNGTPVLAANSGVVEATRSGGSYGNIVILNHGGGQATAYAHLSHFAVSPGQSVSKGQVIGYVGLTGNTSGYHLHFETRVNGSTVNPLGGGYFG